MENDSGSEDRRESYVFVSYSHDDRDRVVSEIQRLEASGISAWYDRAIRPGSAWSHELAEALSGAQALVFFATRHSIESENCADEIVYALDEKIPVVTIYLDDVQLPSGLRLRLASRQAIYKLRLSAAEYEEKLASLLSLARSDGTLLPPGRRSDRLARRVVVGVLLAAVAVAVLLMRWDRSEQPGPEPAVASLAVLPFLTTQADADGLGARIAVQTIGQLSSEQLRARFAPFGTLKDRFYVAPAAASIRDWSEVGLPDLRRALNVNYIVDGTAQLTPAAYVVDARLSRLSDGYQVFSVNLERPARFALAAEQEIGSILALEIINAIAADQFKKMYGERYGTAPWFDLFMTGSREFFEGSMGSSTDYQLVAESMERALELGMPFALARPALVQADLTRRGRSISPVEALRNLERRAATVAAEASKGPLSADHIRATAALYLSLDYAAAESHTQANLARFPNFAGSLLTMAGILQRQGKASDGIRWFERAVAGGASAPGQLHAYALALSAAGNPGKALQQLEEGFRYYARPFGRGTYMALKTRLLNELGRSEEAAQTLEDAMEIYGSVAPEQFAYPLALLGRQAEARATLDKMIPQADTARVSNFMIFQVYLGLGEYEQAISWLRRAIDSRDPEAIRWLHAPGRWGALGNSPALRETLEYLRTQERH